MWTFRKYWTTPKLLKYIPYEETFKENVDSLQTFPAYSITVDEINYLK